jgi:hypothetical protein
MVSSEDTHPSIRGLSARGLQLRFKPTVRRDTSANCINFSITWQAANCRAHQLLNLLN